MDTGAQDAALGAIREAMAQYLIDHEDRYPRADQLVVHVDYHDLHGWLDALDAAEARQTALVETLQDTTLVEALVEVVFCEFGDRAGLDLGVLVDCIQEDIRACLTTAFRAELVKAQGRALAASPALDGVAAEARQASLVALAHELVELEHGARGQQMQALHRLGIVVTLDEHLARARAFSEQQHAHIDALAALGKGGA